MEKIFIDYIQLYSPSQQERMQQLYQLVKEACPQAIEKISWGMPTFDYYGNLVHFAQNKHHLGFYPGAQGVALFIDRLDALNIRYSKGAIQLRDDQELPIALLQDIITMRIKENEKDYEEKHAKKEKRNASK